MDKQNNWDQKPSLKLERVLIVGLFSMLLLAVLTVPVSASVCYIWGTGIPNKTMTCIDPNIIDYSNLSLLIGNMAGIFPGIVTLVVGVLPILITLAIISVIFGILGAVIGLIGNLAHGLLK